MLACCNRNGNTITSAAAGQLLAKPKHPVEVDCRCDEMKAMQADKDKYFGKQKMSFMSNEKISECVFGQGQVFDHWDHSCPRPYAECGSTPFIMRMPHIFLLVCRMPTPLSNV